MVINSALGYVVVLVIIQLYFNTVSAAGWAMLFEPGDKDYNYNKTLYTKHFSKILKNTGKQVNVMLTQRQYEATQERKIDPFQFGYSNLNKGGSYHWVVCDQLLFDAEYKALSKEYALKFPLFAKAMSSSIHYKKFIVTEENVNQTTFEPIKSLKMTNQRDTYDIRCKSCESYLGWYYPYDEFIDDECFEVLSSSVWFDPKPFEYKTAEERQSLIDFGKISHPLKETRPQMSAEEEEQRKVNELIKKFSDDDSISGGDFPKTFNI